MKRVAEALGVSRSNLSERSQGKTSPRGPYFKADDESLLPLIRRFVDERPTYGYRRITALVNRELARQDLPPANRKRVHRIMQRHALLLERHTGRREGRIHDGKVMVMRSNCAGAPTAWSSPSPRCGRRTQSSISRTMAAPIPPRTLATSQPR